MYLPFDERRERWISIDATAIICLALIIAAFIAPRFAGWRVTDSAYLYPLGTHGSFGKSSAVRLASNEASTAELSGRHNDTGIGLSPTFSARIDGVPLPTCATGVQHWERSGLGGMRFEIQASPIVVACFYLDELDDKWIMMSSSSLASSGQGWSGSFIRDDFSRKLYIFALPSEIVLGSEQGARSRVSMLEIPVKEETPHE